MSNTKTTSHREPPRCYGNGHGISNVAYDHNISVLTVVGMDLFSKIEIGTCPDPVIKLSITKLIDHIVLLTKNSVNYQLILHELAIDTVSGNNGFHMDLIVNA
ncbi:hypothetical protein JTB14_004711 [Gonioctena quinquepunctata]|nr:hypothetical protein JTB14_004711 [Gonioctena quinquepunctata]